MTAGLAYAQSLHPDSNTIGIHWTITCSPLGPVCVLFQNEGQFNSTTIDWNIIIRSTSDVTGQYINTTVVNAPANSIFNLNGTTASSWLNGPYSFAKNVNYPFDFLMKLNGTFGAYDLAINVVE